ncbi:MAG: XdhC/CoxF family protein [Syntrophomonadaceae bacterium]|nr:XdhC/CoxF family protein [Syntrophomonadaceae bacterium]
MRYRFEFNASFSGISRGKQGSSPQRIESLNLSKELVDRVYSPIGLDLGGKRTAEIALAVVAEIQAVKYQRAGGFASKTKL